MFKTALKSLGKIAISGIIAFAFLTLFCRLYYYTPVRSTNKDGATDDKYTANAFYFQGREGFGLGKTNNDGFMNLFDYYDDMEIDILIMGSSHMEAMQVGMSQSTASRLNALLESETVYNIGISRHTLLLCARNLRAALNTYQPTKYVVIETGDILFSNDEIASAINEEPIDLQSLNQGGGIRDLLRRNPYLRLIYKQIQDYRVSTVGDNIEEDIEGLAESDAVNNETLINDLLRKMSGLAEEYGVKIIVAYHPSISIASDGSLSLNTDQSALTRFKRSCAANGILFLDMSDRFKQEYESSYTLPQGFANGPVGSGHLNQYGHAMIADELYRLILEDEQK